MKKWHVFIFILGAASFNSIIQGSDHSSDDELEAIPKPLNISAEPAAAKFRADRKSRLRTHRVDGSPTTDTDNEHKESALPRHATNSVRRRARTEESIAAPRTSSVSEDTIVEFTRAVSSSVDRLTDSQVERTAFEKKVYRDMTWTKRFAIGFGVINVAYTVIYSNWPKIMAAMGGGGHPGAPGNGTST